MDKKYYYASYKNYMVRFDTEKRVAELYNEVFDARITLSLSGLFLEGKCEIDFEAYDFCKVNLKIEPSFHELTAVFSSDDKNMPKPEIVFTIDARGISFVVREIGHYSFVGEGHLFFGSEDAYAINTKDTPSDVLYAAIGPASSKYDNAVFDKNTDRALIIDGCRNLALSYDFDMKRYGYRIETKSEGVAERIRFKVREKILTEKYDIDYAPIKRRVKYTTPPAGFMTWYSLKFDSCESRVLENAKFQSEVLAKYGADTIWIDWEWCHRRYERERFDGVDNFHPDPEIYPHGLGYLASEIKKLGLIPALWLGFTNDACFTDYEREHPEISLSHHDTWSGRYYYDMSHPEYLDGYLTKAVNQVKSWGFEAVKYDTLPNAITAHENYHASMLHPELTTYTVFRNMIKKTRELLGEDYYMVSCGSFEQVVLWGIGYFDAARIGPDLFTWEKYVETLGRIRRYYALHSNCIYNDPDCVVLRDEYSSYEQAKSRLIPISLLGLPLNFGDDLTKLPKERLELLKHALPTVNVHPTDFSTPVCDGKTQMIALKIALPYDSYTVAALINLTDKKRVRDVSFRETLRLEDGKYLVYDYFEDKFLGICDEGILLEAMPYDTKLISLHKLKSIPQLISTSRHFTQGAAELKSIEWHDESCTLRISADLICEDEYNMTVYIPEGYRLMSCNIGYTNILNRTLRVNIAPPCSGIFDFTLTFSREQE